MSKKANIQSKHIVKHLDLSNKGIEGELDVSEYSNLEYLDCSNNKITSITGISDKIKYLNCSKNLISNIDYSYTHHMYLDQFICSKNPVTYLFYCFDFQPKKYPKTLNSIEYEGLFNYPIDNLPSGVEKITFFSCEMSTSYFNQPIDNLPPNLNTLTLGDHFNQPIDNLPEKLTKLFFARFSKFNHPIDNLPESVKILYLGSSFNQPVDNLPAGLEHLCLGYCKFNHPINNLPDSITELTLGDNFDQEIIKLPNSLKTLMFTKPICEMKKNLSYLKKNYNSTNNPDFLIQFDVSLY